MPGARALVYVHDLVGTGRERLLGSVRRHHYAHQVQVFAPGARGLDEGLDCPAFTVATIPPAALLHEHFLRDYVRRGSVSVLATGAATERHNALCVTGGVLHLVVDAETYRRLGLDGTASSVHPGGQFFRVCIDLRADGFRGGDSAYDRAHWCLSRMEPVRVLASHSEGAGTCGPVHFPAEMCMDSREARCQASSCTLAEEARIPSPQALSGLAAVDAAAIHAEAMDDLLEWLGFVHGGLGDCIGAGAPVDEFAMHLTSPQVLDCAPGTGRDLSSLCVVFVVFSVCVCVCVPVPGLPIRSCRVLQLCVCRKGLRRRRGDGGGCARERGRSRSGKGSC